MAKSQATYRTKPGKRTQAMRFKASRKLIICGGLLIALLSTMVYYYFHGSSQLLDKRTSDQAMMKNISGKAAKKAQILAEPHFEFYTILPQQKTLQSTAAE